MGYYRDVIEVMGRTIKSIKLFKVSNNAFEQHKTYHKNMCINYFEQDNVCKINLQK